MDKSFLNNLLASSIVGCFFRGQGFTLADTCTDCSVIAIPSTDTGHPSDMARLQVPVVQAPYPPRVRIWKASCVTRMACIS